MMKQLSEPMDVIHSDIQNEYRLEKVQNLFPNDNLGLLGIYTQVNLYYSARLFRIDADKIINVELVYVIINIIKLFNISKHIVEEHMDSAKYIAQQCLVKMFKSRSSSYRIF